MSENNNERDDFWTLDKLVPKRKTTASPFATSRKMFLHEIEGEKSQSAEKNKLNFTKMHINHPHEPRAYCPNEKSLIKKVIIIPSIDRYDFYGSFRNSALLYHGYTLPKCEFAPFYSYMPQYSQLTLPQKNYYFYWRSEVNRGNYIKSDYSYIYLYVYEILNLPDKIPPREGVKMLCSLWREYRKTLTRIDAYFSVWVQDYCLIHELEPPMELIGDFIFDAIDAAPFKEFYLSDAFTEGERGCDALLAYLSDYDWRKCKYAGGENSELYKRHMRSAMSELFSYLFRSGEITLPQETCKLSRSAFPNSLCTHAVKSHLEIEYISLSTDDKLRATVTSCVRYTENKLRALFGVKSRLAVRNLPENCKAVLDGYFDNIFYKEKIRKERASVSEYEKHYDTPKEELSFESAEEIEKLSWTTTLRLVENSEEKPEVKVKSVGQNNSELPSHTEGNYKTEMQVSSTQNINSIDSAAIDINKNSSAQVRKQGYDGLSERDLKIIENALLGMPLEDFAAVERINEAFWDSFGDVLFEPCGDKYIMIEDYREDVREWIFKIMR